MPTPIHVTIPEPCHENWQQMTPNEQGRHCMSCQKTVVDFTLMSDQEILNYISRASSSVCGRFNNDQLNKTYTEKKIKPSFTFRYAWQMITAAFLLTGGAVSAQSKKTAKKKTALNSSWEVTLDGDKQWITLGFIVSQQDQERFDLIEHPLKMYGFVRDSISGETIGRAMVRLKGVKAGVTTNKQGHFEFPVINLDTEVILEVSAKGYLTQEYTVKVNSFHTMTFYLDRDPASTGDSELGTVKGEVMGQLVAPQVEEVKFDTAYTTMGDIAIILPDTTEPVIGKVEPLQSSTVNPAAQDTTDQLPGAIVDSSIVIPVTNAETDSIALPADDTLVVIEDSMVAVAGGITVSYEATIAEKITREVKEWLPFKKALRVYPNPVIPGHPVNINLDINKTGTYKLEMIDASGRLVHVQALQIVRQAQVVNIPTQSSWSRGVYWVRISGATDKKVYQAKVLLQ